MSPDMKYLVWTVGLTLAIMLVSVIGAIIAVGLPKLAGNREGLSAPEGWAGRAARTHRNTLENLPLFAIVVLVAATTGKANAMTAEGAMIFFWARVAYAVIYIAGIPWLRTAAWGVGLAGLLLIFVQLL